MRCVRGIALGCALGMMCVNVGAAAVPSAATGQPAVWRTHDLVVDLNNLSRSYTCDQLWYVFHGVLLRLGVPIDSLNVLPYRCSRTRSANMRSPRVQLSFRMPAVVHGAAVKWAQLHAVRKRITLRPGKPKTLKRTDCRLLRQIRQTLFGSLPVRVVHSDLHCAQGAPFAVTVQVWVASPGSG